MWSRQLPCRHDFDSVPLRSERPQLQQLLASSSPAGLPRCACALPKRLLFMHNAPLPCCCTLLHTAATMTAAGAANAVFAVVLLSTACTANTTCMCTERCALAIADSHHWRASTAATKQWHAWRAQAEHASLSERPPLARSLGRMTARPGSTWWATPRQSTRGSSPLSARRTGRSR